MNNKFLIYLCYLSLFTLVMACTTEDSKVEEVAIVESPLVVENVKSFIDDATIYEVNLRQYTEEGSFSAFEKHLPRLKELGVKILWLMPLQEIGKKNRKGSMGSYYSISDYRKVSPDHGTQEDLLSLVESIHEHEMIVILDWVGNHTAWDHYWTEGHPEFYSKDSTGNFRPPVPDWSDVIQLNYDNQEMRDSMIANMMYWIDEMNFDGFRCDVAGMVPLDFWQSLRVELDRRGKYFLLAEAEKDELHDKAFHMSYGWHLHHIMNQVTKGEFPLDSIIAYFDHQRESGRDSILKMMFTSNHDENSWNGTVEERMGENYGNMMVFSFTIPGMPLIYSGQEAGLNKRLEFFEKDQINWKFDTSYATIYRDLVDLKKNNPVLAASNIKSSIQFLETVDPNLLVYTRLDQESKQEKMLVILNFGDEAVQYDLPESLQDKNWKIWNGGEIAGNQLTVEENSYLVLVDK